MVDGRLNVASKEKYHQVPWESWRNLVRKACGSDICGSVIKKIKEACRFWKLFIPRGERETVAKQGSADKVTG